MRLNIFTLSQTSGRGSSLDPANTGFPAAQDNSYYAPPDRGCEHSQSCLTCPLPICKHDRPITKSRSKRATDMATARMILKHNLSAEQAAEILKVDKRTVYRILSRARKAEAKDISEHHRS